MMTGRWLHVINGRVEATLAQLVEHLIRNQRVAGSTPAGGSKNLSEKQSMRV